MLRMLKNSMKSAARILTFLPYGLDPWNDVKRLSIALGKPIKIVLDVGANVGSTSGTLLKQFDGCRVFAFEPHPPTFQKLLGNVSNHRFVPVQLALSDARGSQTFYEYEGESVLNSLIPNARFAQRFDRRAKELTVEKITVDDFCLQNHIEHNGILKIDTEGNDYAVLKGASRMLSSRSIDFIYFEFNDFVPKDGTTGGSLNEISAYLSEFGFRFVATYTDYIVTQGDMFVVANALMVRGNN